jgi:apolipoprotein N-acyltransferase
LLPLLGIPFVLALAWFLDRAVHKWGVPGVWAYPLGIVSMEVVRDQCYGFTWSSIGYTQWRWLEGIQSAAVFRVHALSFTVLLVNAALARAGAHLLTRGRIGSRRGVIGGLASSAAAVIVLHVAGAITLRATSLKAGPFAAGIQPNIPQRVKERGTWEAIWLKHARLWREHAGPDRDPDLLVCTETSLRPVIEPDLPLEVLLGLPVVQGSDLAWSGFLPRGRGQISVLGYLKWKRIPEGAGLPDDDRNGFQEWNVAGTVKDGAELLSETGKKIIVPFGEYVPWPAGFPGREWLKETIRKTGGFIPDLTASTDRPLPALETPRGSFRFGIHICYEIVFPSETRDYVRRGADFLVNISNDAWFGESSELDLVHVAARFRAVECRRSLFRVSNSGISTLIDPCGRYLATVEAKGRRKTVEGVLFGRIPLARVETPYTRWGDLFAAGFPAGLLLVCLALRAHSLRRNSPKNVL